jgi:hypothetical protein
MTDALDLEVALAGTTVSASDGALRVHVSTDGKRPASIAARLHRPGVVRDALLAMGDVLASDLRRKANDRADYLAYLISRGKGVGKQVWDAQREFLALQYDGAARQAPSLDPLLTVTADGVRLEVMSRDESTYAQLVVRGSAFQVERDRTPATGTTFVAFDAAAVAAIARVRSYRATTLELAPVPATAAPAPRRVPIRWLRAFGQMQAASLLAADRFALSPVDLYNVLYTLRTRKAKTAPRGLRYELVPGSPPRLVLEPWDLVIHGTGGPYRGSAPRILRTWGRNRLDVLARALPHARSLHVAVAGPGLPAIYSVDLGDATLSLALSGWTDAGWAGVSTFDLLAADDDATAIDRLVAAAAAPISAADLAAALRTTPAATRRTTLAALAQLRLGHDLATGQLYARSVLATAVPADALRYSGPREAAAHRLLGEPGAVTLTKVHDLGAGGREIEGQVVDGKAHRTFYPTFTIDREGRTSAASCTCSTFRRAGIKEGPCEHMMALRVQLAREQARLDAERDTPEGRALITAETRTLLRRTPAGAESFRLSLDGRNLTARHGIGERERVQRLRFDHANEARTAYFARLEELATKGYLDATQD